MNAKQEEALREYLQEAIVPLIEQVLVKKLGQAMTYAATELVQPKRELSDDEFVAEAHRRGFFVNTNSTTRKPLTDEQIMEMYNEPRSDAEMIAFARAIEAAHGIWPENSDCHGPDWTDRDGEYLK